LQGSWREIPYKIKKKSTNMQNVES
jgi:hypothetical protein